MTTDVPTLREMATETRLRDLEDLVALGESWLHALTVLGWSPETAERAAYRHGRDDIAAAIRKAQSPDA